MAGMKASIPHMNLYILEIKIWDMYYTFPFSLANFAHQKTSFDLGIGAIRLMLFQVPFYSCKYLISL